MGQSNIKPEMITHVLPGAGEVERYLVDHGWVKKGKRFQKELSKLVWEFSAIDLNLLFVIDESIERMLRIDKIQFDKMSAELGLKKFRLKYMAKYLFPFYILQSILLKVMQQKDKAWFYYWDYISMDICIL